jgi:dienelactone hydrolase
VIRAALLLAALSVVQDAPVYPDRTNLLVVADADGKQQPVRTAADWERRRRHILENLQKVMGPHPEAGRKVELDVQFLEEVRLDRYTRKKITFAVEKGDRVPAYLLIPHERKGRLPAMVCPHPTNALGKGVPANLGDKPNRGYAHELAERGYVAIAPDYPGFGDYKIDAYAMGYASATMKGIWNHERAVDLLQSLPEVDPERIGSIGHSLGGHNAMFVAVFDPRVKAVVSSCGFNIFPKYYKGNLKGWSSKFYMPRIASEYGNDPAKMPFDFPEIVAALAPRPFFVNAPVNDANFDVTGVKDCIDAASPVYALLGRKESLAAAYPDAGHDFPEETRKAAYEFLDRALR